MKILQYIVIAFALVFITGQSFSQSLKFVRTDVDSSRDKFVTATYIFGMDIYAEDVENCTNVTFELRYNQTRFVRFSEWKKGSFGPSTKAYVLPLIDESKDFGRIVVSSGLDNSLDTAAPDNPKVIHLEFSVIPASPNFETVSFSIYNPRATIVVDGKPELIELSSDPVNYTIHSFVNVYPGDADNNGVVDHLDFATVSYFLGMGPNTKRMRSFKREPASTLWGPQAVIAWDTAASTYADADGNGEVNMSDNLVVTYNYDKKHPMGKIPQINHVQGEIFQHAKKTENSIILPIFAETSQSFLAATGSIDTLELNEFTFLGIEPAGDLSQENTAFAFAKSMGSSYEFIVGNLEKSNPIKGNEVIANIILEPKNIGLQPVLPKINNLKGISAFGNIFDFAGYTSVEDKSERKEIEVNYQDNLLEVINPTDNEIYSIEIFNLTGELLGSYKINNSQTSNSFYLPGYTTGIYFAKIITPQKALGLRFIVR